MSTVCFKFISNAFSVGHGTGSCRAGRISEDQPISGDQTSAQIDCRSQRHHQDCHPAPEYRVHHQTRGPGASGQLRSLLRTLGQGS